MSSNIKIKAKGSKRSSRSIPRILVRGPFKTVKDGARFKVQRSKLIRACVNADATSARRRRWALPKRAYA